MTLDSRNPKRPPVGGATSPISLTRVKAAPQAEARVIAVGTPDVVAVQTIAPSFETVRIVPLPQLRTTLGRRLAASSRWTDASPERTAAARRLVAIADALKAPLGSVDPDIAVVRRAGSGAIGTVYSVLNGAVYLDADRCGEWAEGREDATFLDALASALAALRDQRLFQGGTRSLSGLSRGDALH